MPDLIVVILRTRRRHVHLSKDTGLYNKKRTIFLIGKKRVRETVEFIKQDLSLLK